MVFFWATYQGAEIDLIFRRGDALYGIECKRTDAPQITPSIRIALDELDLKHVLVIYPGTQQFPLGSQVEVVPLQAISKGVPLLDGF